MNRMFRIAALAALALFAAAAPAAETLEKVVILKRHGVRAAMSSPERLEAFSARPWPRFGVPPGHLTANGAELERRFGAYYRALYRSLGLLADGDCGAVHYHANRTQRTIASAEALAETLSPGCGSAVHTVGEGESDPLFDGPPGIRAPQYVALARAAVAGRVGNDLAAWSAGHRDAIETLDALLLQCDARPCPPGAGAGRQRIVDAAPAFEDDGKLTVGIAGPEAAASGITESLLMAWADGQDFAALGWRGLDEDMLLRVFAPHQAEFDLRLRTPAVARIASSHLAMRLLATLQQGTGRAPASEPIGGDARIVVVSGHDGTLTLLAGLLNLHWAIPGYQPDQTPPGGALVFERWRRDDGTRVIRARYTAQTLAQLRERRELTLDSPPPASPLFIPGCSTAAPAYDCPLEALERTLANAIDPRFVAQTADE